MKTQPNFRVYNPEQLMLMPPDLAQWLPEDHLIYFVREVVRQLDLSSIYADYDGSKGGHPAYHPEMMVGLLLYGYCVGIASSRQIEKACKENIPFRVLSANEHPDHDTIAEFRRRHLSALAALFVQGLQLCQKAGLVKLGHVSLDGSKVKANASRHKAMSYRRLQKSVEELETEVKRLLEEAEKTDTAEDQRYGKHRRADELPEELRHKERRLAKIKEAKEALEREARQRAEQQKREQEKKNREGHRSGPPPKVPSEEPEAKAQRNFTDPDSRIMIDGATKAFAQAYNCQAAVDSHAQVIVASHVTQQATDRAQVTRMVEQVRKNLDGKPKQLSADCGYYSESNIGYLAKEGIDAYIATGRLKHTDKVALAPRGRIPKAAATKDRMTRKLQTAKGRRTYAQRKKIVEPVFGQIKQVRGFRQFLLRGIKKVSAEWDLICLGHNVLKLFRCGWAPAKV